MKNVSALVKKDLEKLSCPIHNKKAKIGIVKGNISIKAACCQEFQKSLIAKSTELTVKHQVTDHAKEIKKRLQ